MAAAFSPSGLSLGNEPGVHLAELRTLSLDGGFEVLGRSVYAVHDFQVSVRVDRFRRTGRAKQPRDLRKAFFVRHSRECQVLPVRLTFACECLL